MFSQKSSHEAATSDFSAARTLHPRHAHTALSPGVPGQRRRYSPPPLGLSPAPGRPRPRPHPSDTLPPRPEPQKGLVSERARLTPEPGGAVAAPPCARREPGLVAVPSASQRGPRTLTRSLGFVPFSELSSCRSHPPPPPMCTLMCGLPRGSWIPAPENPLVPVKPRSHQLLAQGSSARGRRFS